MKILWVPHTSRERAGNKSRAAYFIERIAAQHTIHEICWDVPIRRSPAGLVSTLSVRRWSSDGITFYHLPRVPNGPGVLGRCSPPINQAIFRWLIRKIVRECEIDVVICSCNWYALGFPPTDLPVPLVLDYFDLLPDDLEARYFSRCQAVLCSSSVMYDRARRHLSACYYLPNGIDTQLFARADGAAAKRRYGLEGFRIVSLIGLTASERLYFLDAIELVARRLPDVRGLVVGNGALFPAIRERVRGRGNLFRLIGPRPYAEMPELFASSDVGLYPADKASHFDAALPIKVLEYSAAGKPVVTPPLDELRRLDFPNLRFAAPTAEGFAEAIGRALEEPVTRPDMSAFELAPLCEQLVQILEEVRGR